LGCFFALRLGVGVLKAEELSPVMCSFSNKLRLDFEPDADVDAKVVVEDEVSMVLLEGLVRG
jgi:hypothetical protein